MRSTRDENARPIPASLCASPVCTRAKRRSCSSGPHCAARVCGVPQHRHEACIDALKANFPTVAQLVGTDWFRAAAAPYMKQEAPSDARLLHYGNGFADFLRDFKPAAALIYLPGVARLDTFWRDAHTASDAPCSDAAWIANHAPDQMENLVLQPHPAARWAWFDDQPIYSIWSQNRHPHQHADTQDALVWRGEGALVTRPHDTVV